MSETLTPNRRDQLIEVAAKLFKQKGFSSASMRDLAAEMGIEAASLYHHIKSKEEILETICFEMANKFIDAITETNDIYFNAEERLRMAIKNHVFIITQNINRSSVFLHEWRSLTEPKLSEFIILRNQYEKGIRVILNDGINEDLFDNVDEKFAALTILSTVNWINEWYKPDGKMNAEQVAEKLSDFIFGGLRKKLVTDINYKP
ncbi:MAG: TetR family transcriptional regulator [Bacteroidia bacterium]|jgi:AcrR family transcriptional regulator|nr:TetR family transcriptional regulator [Bacteroidia bacterium]MBP9689297.1 TetR family transcriptional regulator [Bacteroidia bacterium]